MDVINLNKGTVKYDFCADTVRRVRELCCGGFAKYNILVIGDFMLDRYLSGSVSRISPEAPVPVVKLCEEKIVAGGAGNVVSNLVGLGLNVTAIGRIGTDSQGEEMLSLETFKKAETSFILKNGVTTVKTRILGGGRQQMLRLDRELITETSDCDTTEIVGRVRNLVQMGIDCVIISDYGKGFCTERLCREVIALCSRESVKIFVDPKKDNWSCYGNADIITPNIKELSLVCNSYIENEDENILYHAKRLKDMYQIKNILVTRSEKGATLVTDDSFVHVRCNNVDVYDVSGAGDTMIATLSAFASAGVRLEDCVSMANIASQIVIGKIGTQPINASELENTFNNIISESNSHLRQYKDFVSQKLLSGEECAKFARTHKEMGERVIFTNGCFDIIHPGHIDSLIQASCLGDVLIVGLNSDSSVKRLKGESRPVNNQNARAKVIAALGMVDAVVIFDEDTPKELLSELRPSIIVKGGDYRKEDVAGREFADDVVIVPITHGYSTTGIIEKVITENNE